MSMIRRYETCMSRFTGLLGRATDIRCDIKDSLLKKVSNAYQTKQDALQGQLWSNGFFQLLGAAAGIASALNEDDSLKDLFQGTEKIFTNVGHFVSASYESTKLVSEKDLELVRATIGSGDTTLGMLQQIMTTYQTAMQHLEELKSRAYGG